MSGPPREPTQPHLADIDIYCLKCGYNLRGLSGDPRRCPECFYMNPMGDALIPAEFISAQLRRMETTPTVAVACFALMAILSPFFLALLGDLFRGSRANANVCSCFGVFMLVAFGGWLVSVFQFRDACRGKTGWRKVLWRYHVFGLASMALVFIAVLSAGTLIHRLIDAADRWEKTSLLYSACALVLSIGAVCTLIVLLPRLRSTAKGDMDGLQREVAVEMARQRLREDLAKPE